MSRLSFQGSADPWVLDSGIQEELCLVSSSGKWSQGSRSSPFHMEMKMKDGQWSGPIPVHGGSTSQ